MRQGWQPAQWQGVVVFEYLARHPLGFDRTLRHGGGGAPTTLVCGADMLEQTSAGPMLSILPPVVHLPADSVALTSLVQATIQLLLQEFTHAEQCGDAVLSRLVDVLLIYVLRAWSEGADEGSGGWLGALRDPNLARDGARARTASARPRRSA